MSEKMIRINKGHHVFRENIQVYTAQGKPLEKTRVVGPGDCIKVTQEQWDRIFYYRAEAISQAPVAPVPAAPVPPAPVVVFDPVTLDEEYDAAGLREICKSLGIKTSPNAGKKVLIEKIMAVAPKRPSEDEQLIPSADWSADRLRAYLDEEGISHNAEDSTEDLASRALEHYLS